MKIVKNMDEGTLGVVSITTAKRAVGALGRIEAMDVLPPVVGGIVTAGSTLLIRKYARAYPRLVEYAPAVGALAGVAASIPMYWWKGQKAVISSAVTSVVTGAVFLLFEKLAATAWFQGTAGMGLLSVQQGIGTVMLEGANAQVLPTASVPGGISPSVNVCAFAGRRR